MIGGSIEELVTQLTEVNSKIKSMKDNVGTLEGKIEEVKTAFTALKTEVDEIDAIGEEKKPETPVETESDESVVKPESEGFLAGIFGSTKKGEDVKDVNRVDEKVVVSGSEDELNNPMIKPDDSENADKLNTAIIQDSESSENTNELDTNELNTAMIPDSNDSLMKESLKESAESTAVGGKSRKNRKQKNSTSKKLRGGKRTKTRNQKKRGSKKSKRRA